VNSEVVQRAYSALADRYVETLGTMDVVHPDDLRLIERHLGRRSGPVLDLGCGPGHLTAHLHEHLHEHLHADGADVTGIDLVPEFIAHARATYPGVAFEVGSLTGLDRPDGTVAGVLAWYSLIHVEPADLDAVLAHLRRMLRPGGGLVVGFFDGEVCEPFAHTVITAHRWPVDEFLRRLGAVGFEEVERAQRGQEGRRRPHAVVAARAV
jgi:SAM-dependent methyltransferase